MKNLSLKLLFITLPILATPIALADAPVKKSKIQVVNELLKSIVNLQDNHGTAISGGASALAGINLQLEAINVNGKISFFCAAGASAKIEDHAYAYLGVQNIDIRGCDTAESYEGAFLSFMASGGIDAIANGSIDFALSYGINYPYFKDTIEQNFMQGWGPIMSLLGEVVDLNECLIGNPSAKYLLSLTELSVVTIRKAFEKIVRKKPDYFNSVQMLELRERLLIAELGLKYLRNSDSSPLNNTRSGCKADYLKKSFADFDSLFKISADQVKPLNLASLFPSKKQLTFVAQRLLDEKYFPKLRNLFVEILERDMTGCDATGVGVSLGISTGSVISASIGVSLSNYKKIGPSIPIKSFQTKMMDRYINENGLWNLKDDAYNGMVKTCSVVKGAMKCTWRAI